MNGHDLTDEENVKVVLRTSGYWERQCKPCQQERAREWWRKNRGKKGNDDAST